MLEPISPPRLSTGINGLDRILAGGLPRASLYLLEGEAGSGKTTLAFQFLQAGAARQEPALLSAAEARVPRRPRPPRPGSRL
jgi:circadian clock protein KaiC